MTNIVNDVHSFVNESKFWFPLLHSLLSALIFWIVFSVYPQQKRKNQIRPIVEYDLYCIQNALFSIFDLLFRSSMHSPSQFQSEIRSGKLDKKDFYIALQNKCMNATYLYPDQIKNSYLIIGEELLLRYESIYKLIDKVTNYNEYANTDELLLLEQIRTNLKMYELNEKRISSSSITIVNGQKLQAVVSNLGYMHQSMHDLYKLYMELQKIIFLESKYQNRDLLIHKVQFLYYSSQYNKCQKTIKKWMTNYPDTESLLSYYSLLCDFKLRKNNYDKVKSVLEKKYYNGSLVSSRDLLKELVEDETVRSIMESLYPKEEIDSMHQVMLKEDIQKKAFLDTNNAIADFFEERDTRFKNIRQQENR
ncbi:hypothetical protein [Sulfuricurvum sp. MLSB]|uniref:hypothetical protein n=1 Tax=Sulfuricurvum sp. MLSB TaxID=1537917 RepID=UPI00055C8EAD|nr:hypothetical protein [Sulfuricurvum sp. MLSB]